MLVQSTNYSSDDPYHSVSGKYNDRQKRFTMPFYALKRSNKMLVPGTLWKQYHIEVGKLMTSELLI
jgi:Xaa-Pro aminopeptidase